jgi:hypothetical protein
VNPQHASIDNLIDRTREIWEPRLGHELTCEDARRIATNLTGFFSVLAEWSRANIPSPANDAKSPSPPTKRRRGMTVETLAETLGAQKVGPCGITRCLVHNDRGPSLSTALLRAGNVADSLLNIDPSNGGNERELRPRAQARSSVQLSPATGRRLRSEGSK